MSLYEDKAKGIVTEQRFVIITKQLEQEQENDIECMQEIMEELNLADDMSKDIRLFIDEIGHMPPSQSLTR